METIKLLLAQADRRTSNLVEVAVLDVCYDRAVVNSTRTARLDDFLRQGTLWDFDLIVVGAENLFVDRRQQTWAEARQVAEAIESIRVHHSTPIVALANDPQCSEMLLEAGADAVLPLPLNTDQLKTELRPLLNFNGVDEVEEVSRWSTLGSLFRGMQRSRALG